MVPSNSFSSLNGSVGGGTTEAMDPPSPPPPSSPSSSSSASLKKPLSKELPFLCHPWQTFHRKFGAHVLHIFVAFFLLLNLTLHKVFLKAFQWPDTVETCRAASYCVGIVHTSAILPALAQWFVWTKFESNAWRTWRSWEERDALVPIFRFSNAYFIYDSLYCILYQRFWLFSAITANEWLFLVHHIVCISMFTSAAVMNEGQDFIASLQLLAEISNPLDNIVSFTRQALLLTTMSGQVPPPGLLQIIHGQAKIALCAVYFLSRGILAPFVLMPRLTLKLWCDGTGSRRLMSIFRICVSWGIELGSIPWVIHCFGVLYKTAFPNSDGAEL